MATTKTNQGAKDNGKTKKNELTQDEKRSNFRTQGAKRTMRVIKAIRGLSGVARPTRYAWTEQETEKIVNAISAEMQAVIARFQNPGKRSREEFSL